MKGLTPDKVLQSSIERVSEFHDNIVEQVEFKDWCHVRKNGVKLVEVSNEYWNELHENIADLTHKLQESEVQIKLLQEENLRLKMKMSQMEAENANR